MSWIASGEHPLPFHWLGRSSNPTLVLIPGLGGKGRSWEPFLTAAARRFHVLVFDPPGSGEGPPLDGECSIGDLARATLELLDHLCVERASVIGRSMGGMIAQELALVAPERVSRLVLVSTTARADPHLARVFELWARMADERVPAEIRHRSSLLWCLGARALNEGGRVAAYLRAKGLADRPEDYARQARACAAHDALARLLLIRAPTLVVAGTDDRLTPGFHAEQLARVIPGARLLYIPDAGHLPYVEAPEAFQAGVLEFLEHGPERPFLPAEDATCPSATTLS